MSFSWWAKDKSGVDLFEEFSINRQALGLGSTGISRYSTPNSTTDIRMSWISHHWKEKLEDAARETVSAIQVMVRQNINSLEQEHPDCPCCTCRIQPTAGFDVEQAKRFASIPLDRIWRAGGGW